MVARPTGRLSGSCRALTSVAHGSVVALPAEHVADHAGHQSRALRLAAAVARLRCLARDRRRCGASWSTARPSGGRRNGGPHVCVLADRATGLGRAFRDRRVTTRMAPGRKAGEWPQAAVCERTEEHGLHVWSGFYENAFTVIQRVYRALGRPPGAPLATWTEAFTPWRDVSWAQRIDGSWRFLETLIPGNSVAPGATAVRSVAALLCEHAPDVHIGSLPIYHRLTSRGRSPALRG